MKSFRIAETHGLERIKMIFGLALVLSFFIVISVGGTLAACYLLDHFTILGPLNHKIMARVYS